MGCLRLEWGRGLGIVVEVSCWIAWAHDRYCSILMKLFTDRVQLQVTTYVTPSRLASGASEGGRAYFNDSSKLSGLSAGVPPTGVATLHHRENDP